MPGTALVVVLEPGIVVLVVLVPGIVVLVVLVPGTAVLVVLVPGTAVLVVRIYQAYPIESRPMGSPSVPISLPSTLLAPMPAATEKC